MKRLMILMLLSCFSHSIHAQNGKNNSNASIIDSMLFALTISDSIVCGYLGLYDKDTIYITKNDYAESICKCNFDDVLGKKIVFIAREEKPPLSIYQQRHTTIEILAFQRNKNKITIVIGRHKDNYADITFKKKGKKYIIIKNGVT